MPVVGFGVDVDSDVLWILGVHGWPRRTLDLGRQHHGLFNLRPLLHSLPSQFAVRLGHDGVNELLPGRRRIVAVLHNRVAPVAVGRLAVGIDGNGPRKPLGRGIQILLHIGRVARKERRLV